MHVLLPFFSGCFGDCPRSNTASADADPSDPSVYECSHLLEVRKEASFALILCVADLVADHRTLSAYFADP